MTGKPASEKAIEMLHASGRPVTVAEFAAGGVSRMALKRLADAGTIESSVRGVYRLAGSEEDSRAVWADVSRRMPKAVFCQVSAAAFHGLTQNMAGTLNLALPSSQRVPSENSVAVSARYVKWSSEAAFAVGVDTVVIENVDVRITNPERTVVDLFRYSTIFPGHRPDDASIDPETFHDALTRYLHEREGGSSGKLRKMALEFGVWEKLEPHVAMVNLSYERVPRP